MKSEEGVLCSSQKVHITYGWAPMNCMIDQSAEVLNVNQPQVNAVVVLIFALGLIDVNTPFLEGVKIPGSGNSHLYLIFLSIACGGKRGYMCDCSSGFLQIGLWLRLPGLELEMDH